MRERRQVMRLVVRIDEQLWECVQHMRVVELELIKLPRLTRRGFVVAGHVRFGLAGEMLEWVRDGFVERVGDQLQRRRVEVALVVGRDVCGCGWIVHCLARPLLFRGSAAVLLIVRARFKREPKLTTLDSVQARESKGAGAT